ncbi:MAG: FAD-binding protein, partial [Bacteroidales bacterium]|nr:FAD-binding protein [Bacteroidales bacterium]
MRRIVPHIILQLFLAAVSCSQNDGPEPETRILADGVWVGSGEGRGGTIIASVEVKEHAVSQVTIVSQSESSFAQETINTIVERAVGREDLLKPEVDAISGATLTSNGVIDAINMALLASMGKRADGGKIYTDGSCEIVIVGAGGAGLSAAVAAAEAGAGSIIVLEKQGIIGGNTNYSTGGINAAETEVQKSQGIEDSKQLFFDDTMKGGKNENFPELVWNFVEHAPGTINWLIGKGADLSDVGLMGGSSVKRTHRPKGGTAIGPHLMKVLKTASADENIEIRTSNKVLGLLSSGSAVTGVQVENAD